MFEQEMAGLGACSVSSNCTNFRSQVVEQRNFGNLFSEVRKVLRNLVQQSLYFCVYPKLVTNKTRFRGNGS